MKNYKKKFEPLFEKWKELMVEYVRRCNDDLPYWHDERTNVGFLAAAVWQSGGIAIEEYWVERRRQRKGKYKKGWCDLWGKLKGEKLGFSLEAKQYWPAKPDEKTIKEKLVSCHKDLKSIRGKRMGERRISVCFLTITTADEKKINRRDLVGMIEKIEKKYKNKENILMRYCLPDIPKDEYKKRIGYREPDGTRYYYPGVVLVAEIK